MKKLTKVLLVVVILGLGAFAYTHKTTHYTVAELQEQKNSLPTEKFLSNVVETLNYYKQELAKLPEGEVDDSMANTITAIDKLITEAETEPTQ